MQRLAGIHITQSFESMSFSMGKQWRGVKAGQGLICPKSVRYDKIRQTLQQKDALEGEDWQAIWIQDKCFLINTRLSCIRI